VLRKLGAGALFATVGATGVAAADEQEPVAIEDIEPGATLHSSEAPEPDYIVEDLDDVDPVDPQRICWTEVNCRLHFSCGGDDDELLGSLIERECCHYDGETFCDDPDVRRECACDPYA
jgi:hypothetical protein